MTVGYSTDTPSTYTTDEWGYRPSGSLLGSLEPGAFPQGSISIIGLTQTQLSTVGDGVISDVITMGLNKDPRNALELPLGTDAKLSAWVLVFGGTSFNFSDSTRNASGGNVSYNWNLLPISEGGLGITFSISDGEVLDISITGMACEP